MKLARSQGKSHIIHISQPLSSRTSPQFSILIVFLYPFSNSKYKVKRTWDHYYWYATLRFPEKQSTDDVYGFLSSCPVSHGFSAIVSSMANGFWVAHCFGGVLL